MPVLDQLMPPIGAITKATKIASAVSGTTTAIISIAKATRNIRSWISRASNRNALLKCVSIYYEVYTSKGEERPTLPTYLELDATNGEPKYYEEPSEFHKLNWEKRLGSNPLRNLCEVSCVMLSDYLVKKFRKSVHFYRRNGEPKQLNLIILELVREKLFELTQQRYIDKSIKKQVHRLAEFINQLQIHSTNIFDKNDIREVTNLLNNIKLALNTSIKKYVSNELLKLSAREHLPNFRANAKLILENVILFFYQAFCNKNIQTNISPVQIRSLHTLDSELAQSGIHRALQLFLQIPLLQQLFPDPLENNYPTINSTEDSRLTQSENNYTIPIFFSENEQNAMESEDLLRALFPKAKPKAIHELSDWQAFTRKLRNSDGIYKEIVDEKIIKSFFRTLDFLMNIAFVIEGFDNLHQASGIGGNFSVYDGEGKNAYEKLRNEFQFSLEILTRTCTELKELAEKKNTQITQKENLFHNRKSLSITNWFKAVQGHLSNGFEAAAWQKNSLAAEPHEKKLNKAIRAARKSLQALDADIKNFDPQSAYEEMQNYIARAMKLATLAEQRRSCVVDLDVDCESQDIESEDVVQINPNVPAIASVPQRQFTPFSRYHSSYVNNIAYGLAHSLLAPPPGRARILAPADAGPNEGDQRLASLTN